MPLEVPVGVSGRHIHLCWQDAEALFGPGYEFTVLRELSQPGEFAARETVTIVGPRGVLEGVRILGPIRNYSQVEISMTDGYRLGLRPPVRSGNLGGTPELRWSAGRVINLPGVILAVRHIHIETERAATLNLHEGQLVKILVPGTRV